MTRYSGRISGMLRETFRSNSDEVEQSSERFSRAVEEGWSVRHGVATSDAHGWQLVTEDAEESVVDADDGDADPEAPIRLADGAYPEDLQWLVFENGWIHAQGARWLKDEELVETISELVDQREHLGEQVTDEVETLFSRDDRIEYATDLTGAAMEDWWRFAPTGFVGRPEQTVTHAMGFDQAHAPSETWPVTEDGS